MNIQVTEFMLKKYLFIWRDQRWYAYNESILYLQPTNFGTTPRSSGEEPCRSNHAGGPKGCKRRWRLLRRLDLEEEWPRRQRSYERESNEPPRRLSRLHDPSVLGQKSPSRQLPHPQNRQLSHTTQSLVICWVWRKLYDSLG